MMLSASRTVLKDCQIALDMMEKEEDGRRFRVLWIGALALLRAVGHVMTNVDCADKDSKAICQKCFAEWRKEEIFAEFIEKSRNAALKEYATNASESDIPIVVTKSIGDAEMFEIEGILFRTISNGFGAGNDARDVYSDAIKWWADKITEVEKKLVH